MAYRLPVRYLLSNHHRATTIQNLLHSIKLFSSQSLPGTQFHQHTTSSSSSQDLVGELSRIMSDYRNPQHDIESALSPFVSNVSSNLVEQVLKRCKHLGFPAHRFFLWAQQIPGFQHSEKSYLILVEILGSSKQFPLLWDFLAEMKRTGCYEISREIFWLVFKAYSQAGLPGDAVRAFNRMVDFGIKPCLEDLDRLLYTLCKKKHVKQAQECFDKVKGVGSLCPSQKTYTLLVKGWGDVGESGEAQRVFDEMVERGFEVDLPAWNALLDALCKGGKVDEAYELFRGIRQKGLELDAYSYSIFIHAACDSNDLHLAFSVLDSMKRFNLVPNVFTYNCIIKRLRKNDRIDEAYEVLNAMIENGAEPDTCSYNTILSSHCNLSEVNRALKLFWSMDERKCLPDKHTYNMLLKMLIRIGRFDRVEDVWKSMEKRGFYPSVSTYTVMVHGFCMKKWKLKEAYKYFEMMINEGIPPYTTTSELLRNKLVGWGFAEKTDILAAKMERSSSPSIQEAAKIMRGNRMNVRSRTENEDSDYSDD